MNLELRSVLHVAFKNFKIKIRDSIDKFKLLITVKWERWGRSALFQSWSLSHLKLYLLIHSLISLEFSGTNYRTCYCQRQRSIFSIAKNFSIETSASQFQCNNHYIRICRRYLTNIQRQSRFLIPVKWLENHNDFKNK